MRILLITGWGTGVEPLQKLAQMLGSKGHQIELIEIFNGLDEDILAKYAKHAKDVDVVMGWSLGGQLATLLVNAIEKYTQKRKILITLASNPCFVVQADWQTAMSVRNFQNFKQAFKDHATDTLKKFGFMVCQGSVTSKQDFLSLQSLMQPPSLSLLQQGLNCLEHLNTVNILQDYAGRQLHVLAQHDALVSPHIFQNFANLKAKCLNLEILEGSHGLPVFNAEAVTDKICTYLQKWDETKG